MVTFKSSLPNLNTSHPVCISSPGALTQSWTCGPPCLSSGDACRLQDKIKPPYLGLQGLPGQLLPVLQNIFIAPQKEPCTLLSPPLSAPGTVNLLSAAIDLPNLDFHVNGFMQYSSTPYLRGLCSKTPRGRLKPWIVLNPICSCLPPTNLMLFPS